MPQSLTIEANLLLLLLPLVTVATAVPALHSLLHGQGTALGCHGSSTNPLKISQAQCQQAGLVPS
jgi:hypothetical protein